MTFTFHDTVPATNGRTYIDKARAEEIIEELTAHPNKWAQIPITYIYPEVEGADENKLKYKSRSFAGRVQKKTIAPFSDYRCEAKSRGTDVYLRIVMTAREARHMRDLYED